MFHVPQAFFHKVLGSVAPPSNTGIGTKYFTNGFVNKIRKVGSSLFLGGEFTALYPERKNSAVLLTANGEVAPVQPVWVDKLKNSSYSDFSSYVLYDVEIYSIVEDADYVYVSTTARPATQQGGFGGQRVLKLSKATGEQVAGFSLDNKAYIKMVDTGDGYITACQNLGAIEKFSKETGALHPTFNNSAAAKDFLIEGNTIWVAGSGVIQKYNFTTGARDATFNPNISGSGLNGNKLINLGSELLVAGRFFGEIQLNPDGTSNGQPDLPCYLLAAVSKSTGRVTRANRVQTNSSGGNNPNPTMINDLVIEGDYIYAVGSQVTFYQLQANPSMRYDTGSVMRFSLSTLQPDLGWRTLSGPMVGFPSDTSDQVTGHGVNPYADAGFKVNKIQLINGLLHVMGNFIGFDGLRRHALVRLSLNGSLDNTWNYRAEMANFLSGGFGNNTTNNYTESPRVNGIIALEDGSIFAYGKFSLFGGTPAHGVGKINAGTYTVDPTFSFRDGVAVPCKPTDGVPYAVEPPAVLDIVDVGSDLIIAGNFRRFGGLVKGGLAKISAATGDLQSWNNVVANDMVKVLLIDGNDLYVGGRFTAIGNSPHIGVEKLNLTFGTPTGWDNVRLGVGSNGGRLYNAQKGAEGRMVNGLAVSGNALFVSGLQRQYFEDNTTYTNQPLITVVNKNSGRVSDAPPSSLGIDVNSGYAGGQLLKLNGFIYGIGVFKVGDQWNFIKIDEANLSYDPAFQGGGFTGNAYFGSGMKISTDGTTLYCRRGNFMATLNPATGQDNNQVLFDKFGVYSAKGEFIGEDVSFLVNDTVLEMAGGFVNVTENFTNPSQTVRSGRLGLHHLKKPGGDF